MERNHFMSYIASFNARDFEAMRKYWSDEVELELPPDREGNRRILRGPDSIIASYTRLFGYVREHLEIDYLAMDQDRIACEMGTTFEAIEDHPDFAAQPLRKGDVFIMNNFVHFDLQDGLFHRIRVARYTQDASGIRAGN